MGCADDASTSDATSGRGLRVDRMLNDVLAVGAALVAAARLRAVPVGPRRLGAIPSPAGGLRVPSESLARVVGVAADEDRRRCSATADARSLRSVTACARILPNKVGLTPDVALGPPIPEPRRRTGSKSDVLRVARSCLAASSDAYNCFISSTACALRSISLRTIRYPRKVGISE